MAERRLVCSAAAAAQESRLELRFRAVADPRWPGLSEFEGPNFYQGVHVAIGQPDSPRAIAFTFDGQSWLDVRRGHYIEVHGNPVKVLSVQLHSFRPSFRPAPMIVSGRDWETWGTVIEQAAASVQ
jgi:hypothetical protein